MIPGYEDRYDEKGIYHPRGDETYSETKVEVPCGWIITETWMIGENLMRQNKKVIVKETALGRLRGQTGNLEA